MRRWLGVACQFKSGEICSRCVIESGVPPELLATTISSVESIWNTVKSRRERTLSSHLAASPQCRLLDAFWAVLMAAFKFARRLHALKCARPAAPGPRQFLGITLILATGAHG